MNRIISLIVISLALVVTTVKAANYGPEFETYYKEQIVANITKCDSYAERYREGGEEWEKTDCKIDEDFTGEVLQTRFDMELKPGDYRFYFSMKNEEDRTLLWINSEVIHVSLGTTEILFTKDDMKYRVNSNPYIIFQLNGTTPQSKLIVGENVAYPIWEKDGEFKGRWEVRVDDIWEVDQLQVFSSVFGHANIQKPNNWFATIDLDELAFDGNLAMSTIELILLTQSEYEETFELEGFGNDGEKWAMLSVTDTDVQDNISNGDEVEFIIEFYDYKSYGEWYKDEDGNWEYQEWKTTRRYATMKGEMDDIVKTFELPFGIRAETSYLRIHYVIDGRVFWQWLNVNNR